MGAQAQADQFSPTIAGGYSASHVGVEQLRIESFDGQQTSLAELQALRVNAWASVGVIPQGSANGRWGDSHDAHATHVIARAPDGSIVGAARLCVHRCALELPDAKHYLGLELSFPCAAITRMVVRPDWRKRGVARLLDTIRLDLALHRDVRCVVGCTSAGIHRIAELENLGFQIHRQIRHAETTGRPGTVLVRIPPPALTTAGQL